jgi:hypothetical protein
MLTLQMENKLYEKLCNFLNLPYEETLEKSKIEESRIIKFDFPDKYYKNLVFNDTSDFTLDNFDVELEFCETKFQHDIWEYFRVHTSSIRTNKNIGRCMRILVKHKLSGKYVGILALGSDVYLCGSRDKYIGWTPEIMKKNLKYVMNITTCVGLQPISYNFNIGKLLVALCFSGEVLTKFKEKYGHDLACITTFSINGKSIQYDRMKNYLTYVGETKGYAFTNLTDDIYKMCLTYLKQRKDVKTLMQNNKRYKILKVINYLNIDVEDAHKRGVYVGFTSNTSKAFLNNDVDSFQPTYSSVSQICQWWINRWAQQRYNHLKSEGRLRHKIELHNAFKIQNVERVQNSIAKRKEEIGEEEFKKDRAQYMKEYRDAKSSTNAFNIPQPNLEIWSMKWLAGFFDGDGSLNVIENKYPRVEIGQCNPEPLVMCFSKFGGSISVKKKKGSNSRQIFKWVVNCSHIREIVHALSPHVILEREHFDLCGKYFQALDDKADTYAIIDLLKSKAKSFDCCDKNRINDEYIAGIFDAEGEVSLEFHHNGKASKYSIKITQKSNIDFLEAIREYLGYGTVDDWRLNIYSKKNITDFLNRVSPYLVVKKKQADTLFEFLSGKISLTPGVENIKKEKHMVYDSSKYVSKKKKPRVKEIKGDTKEQRAIQHRINLKIGTSLAKHDKRKVTDEQILDIRSIYQKGGINIEDLANKYGISRQYASDIIKARVLTLEEINDRSIIKNNLDNEIAKVKPDNIDPKEYAKMRTSMGKRKISSQIMIDIMKYKFENVALLPGQILNNFKDVPNLTLAMVKNYVKGNAPIFEFEFPINNYTWSEYSHIKQSLG